MKLKRDIRRVADIVVKILGSRELASKWMFTENPLFGGLTPAQMVQRGRKGKVLKTIRKYEQNRSSSALPDMDRNGL